MLNKNTKLSVVLALVTCTFLSYPVYADDNFSVQRLYGSDRYETCSNIANYFQQGQLDSIIVASGEQFADVLSAGCLQRLGNSPIMLVGKSIKSSDKTLGYIENHLALMIWTRPMGTQRYLRIYLQDLLQRELQCFVIIRGQMNIHP